MARSSIGSLLTGIKPGEGVRSYDVRDEDYPTGIMSAIRKLIGKIQAIGDKLFPAELIRDAVNQKMGVVMSGPGMPKRVPPNVRSSMDDDLSDGDLSDQSRRLENRRDILLKKALAILTPEATKFKFPQGDRLKGIMAQLSDPEELGAMYDNSLDTQRGRVIATVTPKDIGVAVDMELMQRARRFRSRPADDTGDKVVEFAKDIARESGMPQVEKWQTESIGTSANQHRVSFWRTHFVVTLARLITGEYLGSSGLKQVLADKYFGDLDNRFTVELPELEDDHPDNETLTRLKIHLGIPRGIRSYTAQYSNLFKLKFCYEGPYKGLFVFYFDEDGYEAQEELSKLLCGK